MKQKTKNIILVIGFIITTLVAYKYAIVNTLQLRDEYKTLKKEAVVFDNMPKQLSALKQREKYFDSLLAKYQLSESSIQNSLLRAINIYAEKNDLKLVGFVEPHKISKNDLTINTYKFTLEGKYNSIITLIHQLEQETKFGEIININFQKLKNYKTNRFYLQASVLLKSFG